MTTTLPSWMGEGICAQTGPELFFPDRGGSVTEAKELCADCPIRSECLEYALDNGERFGVWGGLSERERRAVARSRPQQPAPAAPPRDYTEVDELLRAGVFRDTEIAQRCGLPNSTVYSRREKLQLTEHKDERTPADAYAAETITLPGGHRRWTGGRYVTVKGRRISPAQLAFLVGYEREPVGQVRATCGQPDCRAFAHLADQKLRAVKVSR